MKKVLAICNTPLQIICAVNLGYTIYRDYQFDVLISDHMAHSEKIVEAANQNDIFSFAQHIKTFHISRMDSSCYSKCRRLLNMLLYKRKVTEVIGEEMKIASDYDILLFNNLDKFTDMVYQYLWMHNKQIKVFLFEDGFSSYLAQGVTWRALFEKNNSRRDKLFGILSGQKYISKAIGGQYVYEPGAVQWAAPFPRLALPKIDLNDKVLVEKLNRLFGYEDMEDTYEEPIIFFEESFRKEGFQPGDLEILHTISQIVGQDRILVKTHPRSDDGKVQAAGYKTNKNVEIPWEIIIMNHPELVNKTLVTLCSGAVATPYTMFGMKTQSIVMVDIIREKAKQWGKVYSVYFDYMIEKVFAPNEGVFCRLKSEADIEKYFTQWKENHETGTQK